MTNRRQRVVLGNSSSNWAPITSGVPQGSVLGPTLFIIYINDLPEHVHNVCKMYADDTKIIAPVATENDRFRLQEDINSITNWTRLWKMELNVNKCKIMHIKTPKYTPTEYYMLGTDENGTSTRTILESTTCERDLGVEISADLKSGAQVSKASAQANKILGSLKSAFVSRSSHVWKNLYSTYVRPHLEFAIQAWSPYLKKDIASLERIQHRATKIPHQLRSLKYNERCAAWSITSLTERRIRGDLIQKFKFLKSFDEINWHTNPICIPPRAGHRERFHREIVRSCLPRYHFFNNRIASYWNELPDYVINADSINAFKNRLDNYNTNRRTRVA